MLEDLDSENKEIFYGEKNSPGKVATAAKVLWVEVLCMKGMNNISKEALTVEERDWVSDLLALAPHLPWINPPKNITLDSWKIRMNPTDFKCWWKKLGCSSLYFDGALKGNPVMAGAGGVYFNSEGINLKEYAW